MQIDWEPFRSGFYGRLAAGIVAVICAFFAFAPGEWIAAVLPLPWTEPSLVMARAIFLVIGGGAVVVLWRYYKAMKRG
jgi:hypothetical protein